MKISKIPLITFIVFQQSLFAQIVDNSSSRSDQEREIRSNCTQEAWVLTGEEAAAYVEQCVADTKINLNWNSEVPQVVDEIAEEVSAPE